MTTLLSSTKTGTDSDGQSYQPALNQNGQWLVFTSDAFNLSTDAFGLSMIYLKDTVNADLRLISSDSNGVTTDSNSFNPSISGDGRYVVFDSAASNLVSDDVNGVSDVFLKDMQTGKLSLASSKFGDSDSTNAQLSNDGNYVVWQTTASNFVTTDHNGASDIYLCKLEDKSIKVLTTDKAGLQGNHDSIEPSLNANASLLAFTSDADNFLGYSAANIKLPIDNNINRDVFVKNIITGEIQLVSQNYKGTSANGMSDSPSLNSDGTKIVFRSFASDLIVNSINDSNADIYVKDLTTKMLTQINVNANGTVANGASWSPVISPDGNNVAFISDASNLVDDDTNDTPDLFIKDLTNGILMRVVDTTSGNGEFTDFAFSGDSSVMAFSRWASANSGATENIYGTQSNIIMPPQREYTLSVDSSDVDEDSTTIVTFTISVDQPTSTEIILPFTLSGTAGKNSDYSGELTQANGFIIAADETSAELSFVANIDNLPEQDETLVLTLATPLDGSQVFDNGQMVTIHSIFQGTRLADRWTGTLKDDIAYGNNGNDILFSLTGNDVLDGGNDNDKLIGGKGIDDLTGGNGKDTFVFVKGDSSGYIDNVDWINDLSKGDKIDLSAISKSFNFIKTFAIDLSGSNLHLSSIRKDIYVADIDNDYYLVYETATNGSAIGHEIIGLGSDISEVSTWAIKLGVLTV